MAADNGIVRSSLGDIKPAAPCLFVLFGATGDLAARKVAPALYNLKRDGLLHEQSAVLGVARKPKSDDEFRSDMLAAIKEHSRSQPIDETLWNDFASRWFYHSLHLDEPQEYDSLAVRIAALESELQTEGNRIYYLAVAPDFFGTTVENLCRVGLTAPAHPNSCVRLIVEKPFGKDLASATELNRQLLQCFTEDQIYRIDHYLGKETVQNMLVLRFANAIFEPLFNRQYVDHVQITTAESVGMEGRRGPYYETAGAMRDMVQNHLLQLLALTTMDAPAAMTATDIRNEKVKVLRAIRPMDPQDVASNTVRGRYAGDDQSPGYLQEAGVAEDSQVETYAAVKLYIDNWRWASVPFYLRTGKRLTRKASRILIVFKPEPISMFSEMGCDTHGPCKLDIRIYPDEGIDLTIDAKLPGARMLLRPVKMDFRYESTFESASPEAYEHLLLDAMTGDQTLFIRNDEVEAAWSFIDCIRAAWNVTGKPELIEYAPGSAGPSQAENLLDNPYMRWQII